MGKLPVTLSLDDDADTALSFLAAQRNKKRSEIVVQLIRRAARNERARASHDETLSPTENIRK